MHELEQLLNRLIEFGLLTDKEEDIIKECLLAIELQLTPKTQYIEFIDGFNKITGKKYTPTIETRELFYENSNTYSLGERLEAVRNATTDPYTYELNPGILRPVWILQPEFTSKYMNYTAPKKTKDDKKLSDIDYSSNEV